MKLRLKKFEWLDNWFAIVRAEHDGREWYEEIGPNTRQFMMSERLSPEACIEGDKGEMLAVAEAILERRSIHLKRCEVRPTDVGVFFRSPKNSRKTVCVPYEDADDFARQVLKELG